MNCFYMLCIWLNERFLESYPFLLSEFPSRIAKLGLVVSAFLIVLPILECYSVVEAPLVAQFLLNRRFLLFFCFLSLVCC